MKEGKANKKQRTKKGAEKETRKEAERITKGRKAEWKVFFSGQSVQNKAFRNTLNTVSVPLTPKLHNTNRKTRAQVTV